MLDTDVVVVGAGPTGLMLAGELGRAGVRTLVLEQRLEPSQMAKAGGIAGQVLQLLHYRGELDRFRMASTGPEPAPRFPFGGLQLDFSQLQPPPMRTMLLPQARLERLLAERATERGVDTRRGHECVDLRHHDDHVSVTVSGPDGRYEVDALFLVGCDGGRSRVRESVGIPFPGTSYPEVERLASVTVADSVAVLDDGSVDVPGVGTIPSGYTATEQGVFACAAAGGTLSVYTAEVEMAEYSDDAPMTAAELSASVRRVLGVDLPMGEPLRMTRFGYSAKQADTYGKGRVFLAGDAAHLFPAGGVAVNAGMLDAANLAWKLVGSVHGWAPPGLLDTYTAERRAAADRTLLHTRAQVALRRGYGPGGDALRALFAELSTDEQALRRLGALLAGADTGSSSPGLHPLVGTFATDHALGVEQEDPRLAGMLRDGRPVLLDFADRPDLRAVADRWAGRVSVLTVPVDARLADVLLVRPDACIAWGAAIDEVPQSAVAALRQALDAWFGPPTDQP